MASYCGSWGMLLAILLAVEALRATAFETSSGAGSVPGTYMDKIGLEQSIAAVFNKVAYGSTTTKRSIPDGVSLPSITTAATPLLTTFRYREREPPEHTDSEAPGHGYELDLERDHALPTSAPNADILKSNSNSMYPNPNRHHNIDRTGHRQHGVSSTTVGQQIRKGPPTPSMFSRDMPSYAPPARSFFTPPLPPEYLNPFADKPTLRGTNSEGGAVGGGYANRRPLPPPSLMPNHERIPFRPPELTGQRLPEVPALESPSLNSPDGQRKKALNTPSHKIQVELPGQMHGSFDAGRVDPNGNLTDFMPNGSNLHYPSISRILSGSNGRKEEIPEVLLRTVTARPSFLPPPPPALSSVAPPKQGIPIPKEESSLHDSSEKIQNSWHQAKGVDEKKLFELEILPSENGQDLSRQDEPKTQPKVQPKPPSKPQIPTDQPTPVEYSTQMIQNLANVNNDRGMYSSTPRPSERSPPGPPYATWAVAWNLHIYLAAILFTILAVYSIFKIICYDKLTHLFSQSYFICLHLTLISICLARIFYLCYDPYNIHKSFHVFVAEILLNLPATFLTVSFATLILFLLRRSLNLKNNRYSALVRPLTVIVGSCVHVGLCVTLHYVESYGRAQHQHQHQAEPRVLGLICQIIYIFVCLSLGLLYLYVYRILKRILRNKSQNYIHGYQNLSYAIHITIATALLFVLLAALQVYGVVAMSSTPHLALTEFNWLEWGYQFSLRLIEVGVITLISWVAGLRTGTSKALQREKGMEPHNVSGFALFPCTSSSSQEHFETDYPAICNANTNLHTYTLRTGKPIYDDSFALNSLGGAEGAPVPPMRAMDFQLNTPGPEIGRSYESGSARSSTHNGFPERNTNFLMQSELGPTGNEFLNTSGTVPDHYENPDFELRGTPREHTPASDNCYSEPVDVESLEQRPAHYQGQSTQNLDFKNFERPNFDRPSSKNEFRASKNLKSIKNGGHHLDRSYENPERRSQGAGSTHSYGSVRNGGSFERRGVRKSGTMSNIGAVHGRAGVVSNGPGARSSGVQTLSSSRADRDRTSGRNKKQAPPMDRSQIPAGYMMKDSPYDEEYACNYEPPFPERPQFDRKRSNLDNDRKENSGETDNNGSMLVAEHGFVRFRALDEMGGLRGSRGKEKRYNT